MGGTVPAAGAPEGALAGIRVIDVTHMPARLRRAGAV